MLGLDFISSFTVKPFSLDAGPKPRHAWVFILFRTGAVVGISLAAQVSQVFIILNTHKEPDGDDVFVGYSS